MIIKSNIGDLVLTIMVLRGGFSKIFLIEGNYLSLLSITIGDLFIHQVFIEVFYTILGEHSLPLCGDIQ